MDLYLPLAKTALDLGLDRTLFDVDFNSSGLERGEHSALGIVVVYPVLVFPGYRILERYDGPG